MKKRIGCAGLLVSLVFLLCACGSQPVQEQSWQNPYGDVTETDWGYDAIRELNQTGILPDGETFNKDGKQTRGELVLWLYRLNHALSGQEVQGGQIPFTDVPEGSSYYDAVNWAFWSGLISGTSDTVFSPGAMLNREQICTLLIRYADWAKIALEKKADATQFTDSTNVDGFARSAVTACAMSQLVQGCEDGWFRPWDSMSRQECAAAVDRLYQAAKAKSHRGRSQVDTAPNAYDSLYDSYTPAPFTALVPASDPVSADWFNDAAFVGDSVSVMLQSYNRTNQTLGHAAFLCAVSLSQTNALSYCAGSPNLPEFPVGSGQHPKIADGVAAAGAQKVYVMLGVNCLSNGVDRACHDLVTLIGGIQGKSSQATILVESVTPMTADSPRADQALNNQVIQSFNDRMQSICQDQGWYFVNVAEAVSDEYGALLSDYSDDTAMGIHFNYKGAGAWANYLLTHVPQALK